jgi:uncharacterized SAM-binding protein YcdF (DUF218 family)
MFMIISKILGGLLDPVGLTLLILAAGVFFAVVLRRARAALAFFVCGFSFLLIFSSPLAAYFLMRGLEGQYSPSLEYGAASAVVLLGGSTVGKVPPRVHVETNHAFNRILKAVRVYRDSGSPRLVLTGGIVDYITDEKVPEADAMFELLNQMFGIDTAGVIIENRSKNTRQNAVYTKQAMEDAGLGSDIILVTSAYHMPRSAAVFRKAGFSVTPAPTGYYKNDFPNSKPLAWMPSAGTLFESSIAIREYLGLAAYKAMGWI